MQSTFALQVTASAALLSCIGTAKGSEVDATLRFYKKSFDNYKEVPLSSGPSVVKSDWFDASQATVFFAHGFTGRPEGAAVEAVVKGYLTAGRSNVVLLNWQHMAAHNRPTMASSYVTWASPNARKLGAAFADALAAMVEAGLRINTTHLVGHSLGAQLFGIAGVKLASRSIIVPWITGLDPASVGYESSPKDGNLNPSSATFVDIVHSDPSKYGYKRRHGTVDYWPNYTARGPVVQPGCGGGAASMFSPADLCNHNRSWQLLVDALERPRSILASFAKNYRAWKNSDKSSRSVDILALGELPIRPASGDYFLTTNDRSPYGRGMEGL